MSESSQLRFSKFAQRYVTSDTHARGTELARLLQLGAPQGDWLALDIATGGGHTAKTFAPYVKHMVACDLTFNMLAAARQHVREFPLDNITFCGSRAERLCFMNGIFDLVTCRIAPHHFLDVGMFVDECSRILKPGGFLLVQDHALPDDEDAAREMESFERLRDPSHRRAYAEAEWIAFYEWSGFRIEHTEMIVKKHHFQTWAARQDCSPETIRELEGMVASLSSGAREWMQPRDFPGQEATFINKHIIIYGRKP